MAKVHKTTAEKLKEAHPYNIFYNAISEIPSPRSNVIYFKDLLCPSLGVLESSLQITDKLDFLWLYEQYELNNVESKPLSIVYNDQDRVMEQYVTSHVPNASLHSLNKKEKVHGKHHAKMGIYRYENESIRIVVSTANLYEITWTHFTQGIWMSPPCPRHHSPEGGESPTHFKKDLLTYLKSYDLEILAPWIDHVQNADFSSIKVFLVTSLPGRHPKENPGCHLQHVENLLDEYCKIPENEQKSWNVIAQVSNMGVLGEWLERVFLDALGGKFGAKLKIIFPTWKQVKNAHLKGKKLEKGMRYSREVHNRQEWILDYLYQWKADKHNKTNVMPHTKFYCRASPCNTKLAWALLSSGNLSKRTWGEEHTLRSGERDKNFVRGTNHEIGVMFFPQFFHEDYFCLNEGVKKNRKIFPLIFDLPLKRYGARDYAWTTLKFRRREEDNYSKEKYTKNCPPIQNE